MDSNNYENQDYEFDEVSSFELPVEDPVAASLDMTGNTLSDRFAEMTMGDVNINDYKHYYNYFFLF